MRARIPRDHCKTFQKNVDNLRPYPDRSIGRGVESGNGSCRGDRRRYGYRRQRFVVTTNAKLKCEVYLNLASRMTLTGINQLWVADITYVRLKGEFVYLAVILDSFSRKVVGWAVDRTLMSSRLTVVALERAVADRQPQAGLVHHSDRGLQYASPEYVAALDKYGMVASMSRPANPYDNASCESFMKTLKRATTIWSNCARTSKSSSRGITIGSDCTRPWAIDLPRNLNNKASGDTRQTCDTLGGHLSRCAQFVPTRCSSAVFRISGTMKNQ